MSDSTIIAVAGAKGGVGKTTTCINLGAVLADRGYRTVVVEFDLAMANLVDFLDLDLDPVDDPTFHDVLAGTARLEETLCQTEHDLVVLPSGTDLDGYVSTDLDRLPELTDRLRELFDLIIFDTPAGLSRETVRPIQRADAMLLVTTPRVSSLRNGQNTVELADRVDTEVLGMLMTMTGTGAAPPDDRIAEFLDVDLFGSIPEDDAVPRSQDYGMPVVEQTPECGAAFAYKTVARNLQSWIGDPPTESPKSLATMIAETEADSQSEASTADAGSEQATAGDAVSSDTDRPKEEATESAETEDEPDVETPVDEPTNVDTSSFEWGTVGKNGDEPASESETPAEAADQPGDHHESAPDEIDANRTEDEEATQSPESAGRLAAVTQKLHSYFSS